MCSPTMPSGIQISACFVLTQYMRIFLLYLRIISTQTGAQKELNANRKSMLGKLSTSSASASPKAVNIKRPDVELQTKSVSPLHHTPHSAQLSAHTAPAPPAAPAAAVAHTNDASEESNGHPANGVNV